MLYRASIAFWGRVSWIPTFVKHVIFDRTRYGSNEYILVEAGNQRREPSPAAVPTAKFCEGPVNLIFSYPRLAFIKPRVLCPFWPPLSLPVSSAASSCSRAIYGTGDMTSRDDIRIDQTRERSKRKI